MLLYILTVFTWIAFGSEKVNEKLNFIKITISILAQHIITSHNHMKCSLPFRVKLTHVNFTILIENMDDIVSALLVNIISTQSKALEVVSFPCNLMQAHEHLHMCIYTSVWIIFIFSKIQDRILYISFEMPFSHQQHEYTSRRWVMDLNYSWSMSM